MTERDLYPNLPADVEIMHCTKDAPMPIENGDRAVELKQLWIHDDAEETEASKELDGNTMFLVCPNCKYAYSCFLGD
jgi:hypothetical protein